MFIKARFVSWGKGTAALLRVSELLGLGPGLSTVVWISTLFLMLARIWCLRKA